MYSMNFASFKVFILFSVFMMGVSSHAFANQKYASIVMDANTGVILSQSRADKKLHPASLTKIMTLVMVFDALENGDIKLRDRVRISRKAASMVPSKLGIPAGSSIRVEDAIYSLVTKSANDVAVALAEHLGQSERNFAKNMTTKARSLGMRNTYFVNASGLHDRRQVSTARDMAKLGRYSVYRYPNYYRYFSKPSFKYRGKTYKNHNKLLGSYDGVDGIKTGYVNASGFNLVASAERDGRRIIGVVFGGKSSKRRNDHMVKLLDRGFSRVANVQIAHKAVPKPGVKPIQGAEGIVLAKMKPFKATNSRFEPKPKSQFEQGDIDPRTSVRFDTGFMALKAHQKFVGQKHDKRYETVKPLTLPKSPARAVKQDLWGVQIGAFNSRVASETAIKTAKSLLPNPLRYAQNTVSPLIGSRSQRIYRARLTGYSKADAEKVCTYFQDCMTLSPSVQ